MLGASHSTMAMLAKKSQSAPIKQWSLPLVRMGGDMKKLKCWNGRAYGVLPYSQWKRGNDTAHVYVCAHSVADIQRLCLELGLEAPTRGEVANYWSPHWGNSMAGIPPERGIWVQYGRSEPPKRITTNRNKGGRP